MPRSIILSTVSHCSNTVSSARSESGDARGLPEGILEPLDVLREQWCAEPTVHGGKSTRPK